MYRGFFRLSLSPITARPLAKIPMAKSSYWLGSVGLFSGILQSTSKKKIYIKINKDLGETEERTTLFNYVNFTVSKYFITFLHLAVLHQSLGEQ